MKLWHLRYYIDTDIHATNAVIIGKTLADAKRRLKARYKKMRLDVQFSEQGGIVFSGMWVTGHD